MKPITVMLVDDHEIVRDSLIAILKFESDIVICAVARDGQQAVELAALHRPDVIVMDIAMPLLNGVESTRQILRGNSCAKVIVLSAHSEQDYVFRAIQEGALGYLLKHASADVLAAAIREVNRGNAYFSPSVARQVANYCSRARAPLTGLSAREYDVIRLIAESFSNRQIADELGISGKTVEKHRQQVMDKLDIHNVAGLTRYAIRHNLVRNPAARTTGIAEG